MSAEAEILVTRDTATPMMARLIESLSVERLNGVVGPACARLTQLHLARLPKNKQGYPSTRFYEQASDSVRWEATPEGPIVRAHKQGLRQRWKGGAIEPVRARALTIPISEESYGRTASEFPGAFVLRTKAGAFLVQKLTGASTRVKADLKFLFLLSKGVNQEPDPSVMPSGEDYRTEARRAILSSLGGR